MPTSQYVYTNANQTPGPGTSIPIRRRSQRIHRKSLRKAQTLHDADDANVDGVAVADPDETILDDHNDETILLSFEESSITRDDGGGDHNHNGGVKPHQSTVDVDAMDVDRHEASGKSRSYQQPSMKEMPKVIRGHGEFLSDDPLTSSTTKSTPCHDTRARQRQDAAQISTTERLRRLANQLGSDESDDDNSIDMSEQEFIREMARKRAQHEAMLAESQSQPYTQQSTAGGHTESDDTDKIVNHNESSSSFDRTQPWEKEINSLDLRGRKQQPSTYAGRSSTINDDEPIHSSANNNQFASHESQVASHANRSQPCKNSKVSRHQQNNEQMRQLSNQEVIPNPYRRKEPLPPPQKIATNVPKLPLEQLTTGQQVITSSGRETWQEEAFRSSLIDLLGAFPSHYVNIQENASTTENQTHVIASEHIDDDSPHSTTSQRAASAQLHHQRLFDAASRSLARLAIASRHGTKRDSSNTSSGDREESPDFDPPSPRSLPAYMSVMNVYDESNYEGSPTTHVGAGNANGVFTGRSVHGRGARTLHLARTPQGGGIPSSSNTEYSAWALDQLAYGSLVLAARVCIESSSDQRVGEMKHRWNSNNNAESCRVAGFAQSSSNRGVEGNNNSRHPVSSALVESSLGFIATAFACVESDIVYSVLKAPLNTGDSSLQVTVFDVLCDLAPVFEFTESSTEGPSTLATISLLALSRGFEAVVDVARHSSMDPSTACSSYTSPHDVCGVSVHGNIDTRIDKSGVGWLSAVGRDLGLKLDDRRNSRPRHIRLSEIAMCSYAFVLSYNPMMIDNGSCSSLMPSKHQADKGDKKRGNNYRGDLFIDTDDGRGNQGSHSIACRQQAVLVDRVYAANATFLAAMIRAGMVSSWLSSDPHYVDDRRPGDANGPTRMNNLCQKLLNIIETAARLRRSVNQTIVLPDPGDGEAVCASSLSLLLLILPKHDDQPPSVSLSTSFRHMGNSSGSIEDLMQSPLIMNMVELALSWQIPRSSNECNSKIIDSMKSQAATHAMYILSDICTVGGASLICTICRERLDEFLHNLTHVICERGQNATTGHSYDSSSVGTAILLFLHLHTGSPTFVRLFLRTFIESSASGDDCAKYFVGGLFHFATDESYSISSCASSLLRALIDGNPVDRIRDRLSHSLLNTFDDEICATTIQHSLRVLIESASTSVTCTLPFYSTRYQPRSCSLGDLLCVCIHSNRATNIFACSMDVLLGQLVDAIRNYPVPSQSMCMLSGAVTLTLVNLLVSFANSQRGSNSILDQQKRVKEGLRTVLVSVMAQLESAMAQGTSVDITHRALKLQSGLISLSDERFVALCVTNANSAAVTRVRMLNDRLDTTKEELSEMEKRYQNTLQSHDNLNSAYHDQRLAFERQIEWTRSESRISAKYESEILAEERNQAEEQCKKESDARHIAEEKLEQLIRDSNNDKSRIKDLEELLTRELKSRKRIEYELDIRTKELSKSSIELERISSDNRDLENNLIISEDKVSELSAIRKEVETDLEEACSKLIKLATVYQRNEEDSEKYKAELRSAMNTANKHADTAIAKYEHSKKQIKLMSKQLEEATYELNSIKAHRADVQRMRKNAPVAYLNQLHNGKSQGRPNNSEKENSFYER